jgi:hypothetical protein
MYKGEIAQGVYDRHRRIEIGGVYIDLPPLDDHQISRVHILAAALEVVTPLSIAKVPKEDMIQMFDPSAQPGPVVSNAQEGPIVNPSDPSADATYLASTTAQLRTNFDGLAA